MLHYTTRKNPEENHQRRLNIASNDRQSMEGITKKVKNYVFNLRDVLGKGSFSTVYLGHHQTTFEIVAIKVI
jgi:serine/threonine protein kinase